jgi:hypothetical protein
LYTCDDLKYRNGVWQFECLDGSRCTVKDACSGLVWQVHFFRVLFCVGSRQYPFMDLFCLSLHGLGVAEGFSGCFRSADVVGVSWK